MDEPKYLGRFLSVLLFVDARGRDEITTKELYELQRQTRKGGPAAVVTLTPEAARGLCLRVPSLHAQQPGWDELGDRDSYEQETTTA